MELENRPHVRFESRNSSTEALQGAGAPPRLKGQMQVLSGGQLLFLGSPYVTSVQEVLKHNLRLSSFPLHDVTRDVVLLNQQRLNDVDDQ